MEKREYTVSDRAWGAILAGLLLVVWAFSALVMGGCVPPSQQGEGIELRSGAVKGFVVLQSGDTITRVDLGAMVAASDDGADVRVLAASVSLDADLGTAQVGVDVDKAEGAPHVITLRWGSFSYRLEVGTPEDPDPPLIE